MCITNAHTTVWAFFMTKIVYNNCYGGFGLSKVAMLRYAELKGITVYPQQVSSACTVYWTEPVTDGVDPNRRNSLHHSSISRIDPVLVQVIEELGSSVASDNYAELTICDLPVGTRYRIDEYDGNESIRTIDEYRWDVA